MVGINVANTDAQTDIGKDVSNSSPGSLVISKGTAIAFFIQNNLKVKTNCAKTNETGFDNKCKYVKGFYDDYTGKSDLETPKQVLADKSVTVWIQDENNLDFYQSVLDNESEEKKQTRLQCVLFHPRYGQTAIQTSFTRREDTPWKVWSRARCDPG